MAGRDADCSSSAASRPDASYWTQSRRPLHIFLFLLPLVLAYELGLALVLRGDGRVVTNRAHETLLRFFEAFGITAGGGLLLGGIAILVVLILWHILNRDRWQFSPGVLGVMAAESLALALPLLALGRLIAQWPAAAAFTTSGAVGTPAASFAGLDPLSALVISIGAGLYEELLFRMLLIAVVHTLLVDVGKASHAVGATVAVVVAAVAFAAYHPLGDAGGGISPHRAVFYFVAGLYFGVIYVFRGFGIVVGAHAGYDIISVALLTASGSEA